MLCELAGGGATFTSSRQYKPALLLPLGERIC